MKKIAELVKEHAELFIFFFFLTTSLFLGDGKQPFVDVWWALGILMMYGVRYYQRGKLDLRPLPRLTGWAWATLILYYIVLIPFSDSAGYSITTTMRLIEAYLAYLLFYTISSERVITLFTRGLLFVGVVATLASFLFLLSPPLARFLPPMNLIYATYGHNHLADLLLFIFPIAITQPWFIWAFFSVGMIFTFARGAWLLIIFYLLFLVWKSKNIMMRRAGLFIAAATTAVFLFVSLFSIRGIPQKPSLLEDGRWGYWRQAVEAIRERPLFGSGPGTFYLESKRLQSAPSSYSWFAHSAPLQIAVETGVVGLVIFLVLFWNVLRKSQRSPFLWGVGLVLTYSLYEFSLEYATMWLLVWAGLGVSLKHDAQNRDKPKIVAGTLIVLALFYVSSIGSTMASVAGNQALAFFLAPYDANTTKELLEEQEIAPLQLVTFFHRKNPEVLFRLAQKYDDTQNAPTARRYYEFSKNLDPLNEAQQEKRGEFYLKNKEFWKFFSEYRSVFSRKHPHRTLDLLKRAAFSDEDISTDHSAPLRFQIKTLSYSYEEASKNLFLLGLALVDANPLAAKQLFVVARDLSPNWSYFHLALSSYFHYYENQKELARDVLRNCLRFEYAGDHCADVMMLSIPSLKEINSYVLTMP